MAITLVQTGTGGIGATTSGTVAFGSPATAANLIFVAVQVTGTATVSSITDTLSNTYTKIQQLTGSSTVGLDIWYAKNITGGSAPTLTINMSTTTTVSAIAREYSGLDTVAPLDKSAIAAGVGGTLSSGATAVTTQASELVIGAEGSSGTGASAGAGYGNFLEFVFSGSTQPVAVEDKTVAATGAQTAAFVGGGTIWVTGVATFKATSAVATRSVSTELMMGV